MYACVCDLQYDAADEYGRKTKLEMNMSCTGMTSCWSKNEGERDGGESSGDVRVFDM